MSRRLAIRFTFLLLALAGPAAAVLDAQPVSLQSAVSRPLPRMSHGTRIRVWTDAVGQLRILSSRPEFYEGTFVGWVGDSLVFELNEPVATVFDLGIGHMETENTVPLDRVSRVERQRFGTTPRRLRVGLALGAVAGGAMALLADGCGADGRCSAGERAVAGTLTLGLVTPLVAIRRFWEEVPLPGR